MSHEERVHWCIPILIVAALIAAFLAAPIAATTMVSVDKKQVNAEGAPYSVQPRKAKRHGKDRVLL
jgi:ABC-type spermidine/putrescine transport system permease subunit II